MEKVVLNNVQLDYLAFNHPQLGKYYVGTTACDKLPTTLPKEGKTAFIVNTDPHDKPGRHWIAVWIEGDRCELLDSFSLSLDVYPDSAPLQQWLQRHFKEIVMNSSSLQAFNSDSCGDYALMYLIDKSNGRSMEYFVDRFKPNNFVWNDHHVGQMLKHYINSFNSKHWKDVSKRHHRQRNK